MENDGKLFISSSPHILNSDSTKGIMWTVSIFLIPPTLFGIYAFGLHSLFVVIASILSAIITEGIIIAIRKKKMTISDGSAFLTGLIIGMNLPPQVPLYIPIISSVFAIAIVKQAFGGLGQNWANPAVAARVFALFAWTKEMTTWNTPFIADALTTATPLGASKTALVEHFGIGHITAATRESFVATHSVSFSGPMEILQSLSNEVLRTDISYFNLFFGFKGGCIGEISIFLLLIGAAYLIYRKIITIEIPLFFIGTVLLFSWAFDGLKYGMGFFGGDALFQFLTGGLVFGAFFCATDMVTTPLTIAGRIIFGIGCGLITVLVRMFGGLPEGVSLAILFMNMLTPTIDRIIKVKPFGYIKEKKA
ncbi:MAG TPA: RnfABCDGE type electron transport complex subunit D [Spirochaetota bacterium]|nr:RnfABCDGE type electron transport complex subunit D [Spirochaetota bacterium]